MGFCFRVAAVALQDGRWARSIQGLVSALTPFLLCLDRSLLQMNLWTQLLPVRSAELEFWEMRFANSSLTGTSDSAFTIRGPKS